MTDLTYWGLAVLPIGRNARKTQFLRSLLTAGIRADVSPKARAVDFLDSYPEAEGLPVNLGRVDFRRSNMDPLEQYMLAALAAITRPKRIFEIGTFDGATTLLLSRAAPDAEVFTIDLPPEVSYAADMQAEEANAAKGSVGSKLRDSGESRRVTQLFGDSPVFDFSPWYGSADLVLVDAGHSYQNAASDSATARSLVSPQGLIVWDDYTAGWPGVVQAVDELPILDDIVRPRGTALAIYDPSRNDRGPR